MQKVSPHGDQFSAGLWRVGRASPRPTPPQRAALGERWPTWSGLALWILLPALAQAQSAGPVVGFQKLQLAPGQHELDRRLAAFALDTGAVSGVANGRLLCATGRWETNRWANHQLLMTSGAGAGLFYTVHSNTDNQMQVAPDPLTDQVVLVGARFELLPNLEDDFGAQLAAGDGVGVVNAASNGHSNVWKDAEGTWRDSAGNPATLPLLPGQRHRVAPGEAREVVISGRVLWQSKDENDAP